MNSLLCDSHKHNDSLEANSELHYIETHLVKTWCNLLNKKTVTLDDSFFYYGADSITVLKLIFSIQEHFHTTLLFRDIFDNPTISKLTVFIEKKRSSATESNLYKIKT